MTLKVMRKGVAKLADMVDGALTGTFFAGAAGNVYYVDPTRGSDGNSGLLPGSAKKTLQAGYNLTTNNNNDVVVFIGGATADNPSAAITWSNSYTHLVGVSSPLYGLGQRCRVVALAATGISPVITFSGNGCIVTNMQFSNERATGTAYGVVAISGLRNYFENVFFMPPTSATAASYSCKLSAAENVFVRCTFGQLTNFRSEASYGLWITGAGMVSRNKFVDCEFLAWQGGAGSPHVHVYHDSTLDAVPTVTWFENCHFLANYGGGTIQTQAIDDNSTASGHQIVLRGQCDFLGCSAVADTLTYIFAHDPEDTVSGCLMIAVAES